MPLFVSRNALNIFIQDANFAKLTSMHFYAWKKGLKTGMYYLRTKAAADAIKFTVERQAEAQITPVVITPALSAIPEDVQAQLACSLDNPENCEMCGS